MRETKKAIDVLREWLEIEGNTTIKLASQLGYKSNTVQQWIKDGAIPQLRIPEVLRILKVIK